MTDGKGLALLLLNLAGGISGLVLAWKNYRLQARTTIFDDTIQLLDVYRQEIARLRQDNERLDKHNRELQKRVLDARHEAAVWQQRLEEYHQKED